MGPLKYHAFNDASSLRLTWEELIVLVTEMGFTVDEARVGAEPVPYYPEPAGGGGGAGGMEKDRGEESGRGGSGEGDGGGGGGEGGKDGGLFGSMAAAEQYRLGFFTARKAVG